MRLKKKNPTVRIAKDIKKATKRNYIRLERLRASFKREYEHACNAGPEDGCQVCDWIENATYTELKAKIKEFEDERKVISEDHLYDPEQEYEPPTPSDGQDAKANFNNDAHGIPDLPSDKPY